VFQQLKLKKKSKYIILTLNKEKTEVIVEKTSLATDYDDFLADLPETECRWAVYDFEYQNEEGSKRNKIILFSWCVLPSYEITSTFSFYFLTWFVIL
jgi:cofilin